MFWIIVIAAIVVLIMAVIDFSYSGWNITKEFFASSWWGMIVIILGILAAFLFYGSSKTYTDVKINESFLPNPYKSLRRKKKGNSLMSKIKKATTGNKKEIVEFDLSQLTMAALTKRMAYEMTKPGPVFFKGWGNKRLKLDVERVQIIGEYVESIRGAGESLVKLQADAVLSYEKVEHLVNIQRNELLYKLKDSQLKLDLLEKQYKAEGDKLKLDIKHLETVIHQKIADIENRSKEVDAEIRVKVETAESNIRISEAQSKAQIKLEKDKTKAEIFVMKLKAADSSRLSGQRSAVLDKIIEEMNLDNLRPIDVYLLIKLLEASGTDEYVDFDSRLKMVNEQITKMKLENKKASAEAREANAKANEIVEQSKQNIQDLYKNK